jgi:hypothetical protein
MLLALVLGFVAGSVVGMFVIGLAACSARRELEWELATARELIRTGARAGDEMAVSHVAEPLRHSCLVLELVAARNYRN